MPRQLPASIDICVRDACPPVIPPPDVTRLLRDASGGEDAAHERLFAVVYGDLRTLAQARLRNERDDHTLSATALVHEAYLRLVDATQIEWADRAHFYAVAAQAMRRILVDWARARRCAKRGSGVAPRSLDALAEDGVEVPAEHRVDAFLALDEALDRLTQFDARKAKVVECRYFGGLTVEETAAALGLSPTTVKADWALARAWLHRALGEGPRPTD
jgi:RNA polymerase sigma factor (TIGR02999 family)